MPIPNPDPFGIQRKLDEERMQPTEPPTKAVTISEIEKILAENSNANDAKLAAILSELSLSERAVDARLTRWTNKFLGTRTRQALIALADGSAFLPLPAEDVPSTPAPQILEQRRIISEVANYLSQTLPNLPNFTASRHTTYFEDRPPRQLPLSTDPVADNPLKNRPLHITGTSNLQVAYVLGHEVAEKKGGIETSELDASRFSTAGEFGPILYGAMMDAAQSRLVWSGWEPGPYGPFAVFRFDASKEKSHYSIKPRGATNSKDQFTAYHGELAVDPADGTILRISVIARPDSDDAMAEADIAVEYGRVEIGQHFYICPVHGVALSKVPLRRTQAAGQDQPLPFQTQLNDVVFDQYHVFRGDPHILQEAASGP